MITIEKAIENLSLLNYKTIRLLSHDEMEAIKLGSEALKRFQNRREPAIKWRFGPLPGETEE